VMWHTPLGLPVVQPYRRKDKQHVRTLLQVGGGAGREEACWHSVCGLRNRRLHGNGMVDWEIPRPALPQNCRPSSCSSSHMPASQPTLWCRAWCWLRTTMTCPPYQHKRTPEHLLLFFRSSTFPAAPGAG